MFFLCESYGPRPVKKRGYAADREIYWVKKYAMRRHNKFCHNKSWYFNAEHMRYMVVRLAVYRGETFDDI